MKHFQGYLGMFWDSDANSVIITGAQLGGGGGGVREGISCPFLKSEKVF